jgi:hypothetical protein
VVVSIIGTGRFSAGYGRAKVAHEQAMLAGPIPAAVLRAARLLVVLALDHRHGSLGTATLLVDEAPTSNAARADPSFEDGGGHVIGHFIREAAVSGEAGVRPRAYVESVDDTLERVSAHGGALVEAPYAEGDLRVATFRDPAGNVIGIWQRESPH